MGDGTACPCVDFQADARSDGRQCTCGHARVLHRTDIAQQTLAVQLLSSRPHHWQPGAVGLVPMTDPALLSQFQFLLDATHLETPNWTRDRGCALHGVNKCAASCAFANQAPVPRGYRLAAAWRNQNPALWARYSLMRAVILQDCARGGAATACHVESSMPAFEGLDGTSLVRSANEWRLFHGTSESACRAICGRNFNLALAGTGATWKSAGAESGLPLYGRGVYLSERITKADEYSKPGEAAGLPVSSRPTQVFSVLLCRAVGGCPRVCVESDVDAEALRSQVFDGPYHSVLGDRVSKLGKPYREIIIYDRDQLYPEFLLAYTRIM